MDADGFNEFFSSTGKKVTEHFGPTILHDFFPCLNSIFILPPIDFKLVYEFLVSLPNSVSLDLLNMDNYVFKLSAGLIKPCLVHIFNLSVTNGEVPSSWKTARVTPVLKGKGSRNDFGNQFPISRPISIITTVAKILEAFLKSHIVSYLTHNKLLSNKQF